MPMHCIWTICTVQQAQSPSLAPGPAPDASGSLAKRLTLSPCPTKIVEDPGSGFRCSRSPKPAQNSDYHSWHRHRVRAPRPSRLVSTADSTRPSPAPPTRARPVTKRRNCSSRGTKYFLTGEKSAQNPLWRNLVKKNQNRTADIKIRARPETKKIRRVGIKSPGKIQTFQKFEPHKS